VAQSASAQPSGPPLLPQGIAQYFVPPRRAASAGLLYKPMAVAAADVALENSRYGVNETRRTLWLCPIDAGPVPVDWERAAALDLVPDDLDRALPAAGAYGELPQAAANPKSYAEWEKLLERWLRGSQTIALLRSAAQKAMSQPGEQERDFRIRLQQLWRERRDEQVEALRKRYATRTASLTERLRKAEQVVAREEQEASQQKWSAAASVGQSILGALFGRKRGVSISGIGSSIGRVQKQSGDIGRAQENVEALNAQLAEIEAELQAEIGALDSSYDALAEQLEPISVAPKASDVHVHFVGLAWAPHAGEVGGMLEPAW
jgi:hypothetical protein